MLPRIGAGLLALGSASLAGCIIIEAPLEEVPVICDHEDGLPEGMVCMEEDASHKTEPDAGAAESDETADALAFENPAVDAGPDTVEADPEDQGDETAEADHADGSDDANDSDASPDEAQPAAPCDATIAQIVAARPGGSIDIRWNPETMPTSQVYVSIHREGGQHHYHNTIVPNDGHHRWTLPRDLDPDNETYLVYIETAEDDQRARLCWGYAPFDVLPTGCDATIEETIEAQPGDGIDIRWNPLTIPTSQIYIAVLKDNGDHFYHHGIAPNNGHFRWTLPLGLEPDNETYLVYIETAEDDQRTAHCWDYASLDVL